MEDYLNASKALEELQSHNKTLVKNAEELKIKLEKATTELETKENTVLETNKSIEQLNSIIDKNHEEFNVLNSKFLNQSQELHEVTNNHKDLLKA